MALRQILVGKGGSTAAPLTLIQGDNHTQIIQMIVQRYYGGVDLGGLTWDVVFENAAGVTDTHYLTDVKVGDANISCNWKPHGPATQAAGLTKFQLEGYAEGEDGAAAMVWQSGVYYFNVSEDMNDVTTDEENAALTEVQKLILYVNTQLPGVLQAGTDAAAAAASASTAAADANAAAAQAVPAAEAANTAATSATNAAGSANTAAARANTAAEGAEAARDNIQADLESLKERMPVVGNDPESHYMLEQRDIDETLSIKGKVADAKVVGDRFKDMHTFVTPEMFGAIGDGVADDTNAIQTAINSSNTVIFRGNYLITSTVFVRASLIGDGNPKVIIPAKESFTPITSADGLNYGAIVVDAENVTIKGIAFESVYTDANARYPNNTSSQIPAICITDGGNNASVEQCECKYFSGHAFIVWGHDISNVMFGNCTATECGIGFSTETRNDNTGIEGSPKNITFVSCDAVCNMGCAFSAVYGMSVSNCRFIATHKGDNRLVINEVLKDSSMCFGGCYFGHDGVNAVASSSRALTCYGAGTAIATLSFDNCIFDYPCGDAVQYGLYLSDVNECYFRACRINTPVMIPKNLIETNVIFEGCRIIPDSTAAQWAIVVQTGTVTMMNSYVEFARGLYTEHPFTLINNEFNTAVLSARFVGKNNPRGLLYGNKFSGSDIINIDELDLSRVFRMNNDYEGKANKDMGVMLGIIYDKARIPTGCAGSSIIYNNKPYWCYGATWRDANGELLAL